MIKQIKLKEYGILIALILIAIILSIATEGVFCSARNLTNLTRQVTDIGILALGMTYVILLAEIDLSVGSVVAVTGVIAATLQVNNFSVISTVLITLIAGLIIGMWNGFWVAHYKIHSFIITLGMMVIARGLALIIAKGASIGPTSDSFQKIGKSFIEPNITLTLLIIFFSLYLFSILRKRKKRSIHNLENLPIISESLKILSVLILLSLLGWVFCSEKGVPTPVIIWAILAGLGIFVLNKVPFGRYLYAIGGNIEAAKLSGIKVKQVKFIVFTISGVLAATSGIILTSRLNGAAPSTLGVMYELDAIASVVIGGTSLLGGVGHITGTIIGTFLIGILSNGMSLMGIPTDWQNIAKGLIIVFAAWFDIRTKGRR